MLSYADVAPYLKGWGGIGEPKGEAKEVPWTWKSPFRCASKILGCLCMCVFVCVFVCVCVCVCGECESAGSYVVYEALSY